ncbi:MAG: sigma-70 family RNA polymerase sigma factor [Candidatus Desulfatibia sp.]|uniref:sigma-70 family RNA polymerase sigma factor n=1 Tax=Candidatus Desulfatibia sp. TaxID=3101189 RepID=UPI002F32175F
MVSKQHEKRNLTRRKLIDKYMPTVRRIVLQYNRKLPPKIDINDLVSAGVVGLLRAMEKFDPERGVNFTSFANYHIKGSILDELRQWDHLTRGERQMAKRMEMTYLELEQKLKRQPTDEEVAQAMQLPLEKFYKHKALSRLGFLSYEDHWDGKGAEDLLELIFHKELKLELTRAISRLPRKEGVVIDFYYFKGKTLKAAAEFLKVSEGRASQLHKQAMERLAKARRELEQVSRPDR